MAKKRRNPWASEAAQEALVRYGPEISALNELQNEATSGYDTSVLQAKRGARGVVSQVAAERPAVRQIYDRAGLSQARTATTLEGDTASLGGVADSIKAGASLEQTVGLRHLREAKAAALTDLSNRAVAAREGRVFAVNQAKTDLAKTLAQIFQRRVDLGNEMGAFQSSTANQLLQADLDRKSQQAIAGARLDQQERDSLRSAGIDPNTGQPIKNGKLDPNSPLNRSRTGKGGSGSGGKGGRLTPGQVGTAQDTATLALDWATRLRNAGLSRPDVQQALLNGRDAQAGTQLHDPTTGKPLYNKDGTPRMTKGRPKVPAIGSQVLLAAALDEAGRWLV